MIEVQNNSVPLGLPNQVFVTESPSPKSYIILHVHRQLTKIPKIQSNIDAHQKPSMKSSKHYNISSSVPYVFLHPTPRGISKNTPNPRLRWLRRLFHHKIRLLASYLPVPSRGVDFLWPGTWINSGLRCGAAKWLDLIHQGFGLEFGGIHVKHTHIHIYQHKYI